MSMRAYHDYFDRFRKRFGWADRDLRGHVPQVVIATPLNIETKADGSPHNYCRSRGPLTSAKGTGRDRRIDFDTRRAEVGIEATQAMALLRTAAARALTKIKTYQGDTRAVLQAVADAELLVFGGSPGSLRGDRPEQIAGLLKILGRYAKA